MTHTFNYMDPNAALVQVKNYYLSNFATLPEPIRDAVTQRVFNGRINIDALIAAFEFLVTGLYVYADEMPNYEDGLVALGNISACLYQDNLWGRGDRAYQAIAWVTYELADTPSGPGPEIPEPHEEYSLGLLDEPEVEPEEGPA